MNDYSLLYKKKGPSVVFIDVYVDNILLTDTDLEEIEYCKNFLHNQFKIKDLGKLHYFLGREILYTKGGVLISQRKFTLELLRDYHCSQYSSVAALSNATVKLKANEGKPILEPSTYIKLIGKLNFLTNTRLDIAYGVPHLSQFMQDHREPHLQVAYHILRYLKKNPTLGLFMNSSNDFGVQAFCDSN